MNKNAQHHRKSTMAEIGKINHLTVIRELEFGVYFDGGELGKILLPRRQVDRHYENGEVVEVFIYRDSDDRLLATTRRPLAEVGEFAWLRAAAVTEFGAFLEWGLPKDLLVPFREQKQKMEAGKYYLVYIYLDEKSGRIVASSKLDKFINPHPPEYQEGQEVTLLIYQQTDIGYSAIINQAHWGLLYNSEVFQKISPGQKLSGYIAKVREDGKIDLTLHKPGYDKVEAVAENIIRRLIEEGGFIAVTDKSAPEKIYQLFGVSKKTYKMAVGALYKQKLIVIEKDGIRLSG